MLTTTARRLRRTRKETHLKRNDRELVKLAVLAGYDIEKSENALPAYLERDMPELLVLSGALQDVANIRLKNRKTRCDGRQPVCVACEDRGVASTCNFDYVRRQRTRPSNAGEKKRQSDRALPADPVTRREAISDLGNVKQQTTNGK